MTSPTKGTLSPMEALTLLRSFRVNMSGVVRICAALRLTSTQTNAVLDDLGL
jgi:hypothetical protein